jgi:hypothetical protein
MAGFQVATEDIHLLKEIAELGDVSPLFSIKTTG